MSDTPDIQTRWRAYSQYKDGSLDWFRNIPQHWTVIALKHLSSKEKNSFVDGPFGSDLKNEDYTLDGVPLIQLNNISGGYHVIQNMKFISVDKAKELERHIINPGDIVIAKMAEPVARAAQVVDKYNYYVVVADCVKFAPNTYKVFPPYLVYSMNSSNVRYSAELMAGGTTRLRINLGSLKDLKVLLPPPEEQRAIATFLDRETAKLDDLIATKRTFIERLKEKRSAMISQAVTQGLNPDAPMKDSGIEWLGEIPEHWEEKRIKHVLINITDTEHKTAPFYDDGEYLVVRTTNVKNGQLTLNRAKYTNLEGYIEWTRRAKPRPGDIIFTREAPAGEACVIPDDMTVVIGQRTVLFRVNLDLLNSEFAVASLYSGIAEEFMQSLMFGSTVHHFNMRDIGNIPLLIPPLEEQQQISDYLDQETAKIDQLIEKTQATIDTLTEYRTALISAAVTGAIDVRDEV